MSLCVPGRKSKVLEKERQINQGGGRRREVEEVDKERYTDRTRRRKKYQRARWFGKLLETKKTRGEDKMF